LRKRALAWIDEQTAQTTLFPEQNQRVLVDDRFEFFNVNHNFAFQFFMYCFDKCSLSHLTCLLLDLAIMRLIEPISKLRSIELLSYYFGIKYSQRIYRNIPKRINHKAEIEQCAYSIVLEKFNEPFYFILYDGQRCILSLLKSTGVSKNGCGTK
jgi:hypothetical protein